MTNKRKDPRTGERLDVEQRLLEALEREHHQLQLMEEYQKQREEQLAIFDALAASYANVLLIDISQRKLKILKVEGYVERMFTKPRDEFYDYDEIAMFYAQNRVHPKDRERMAEALSFDIVKKKLSTGNAYSGNYMVLEEGETHYYQFKFIDAANVGFIIAGFQNIDSLTREVRQRKAQMEALCMDYTVVFNCDLLQDTMSIVKVKEFSHAYDKGENTQCFSRWNKYYYDTFIVQDSDGKYLEEFDNQHLMEYLQDHDCLITRYRVKPNKAGMEYFEVRVVPVCRSESSFQVMLAYRSIDELVANEHRQQQQLSRALAEAEQSNRAKTTFLNSMSHDIRTPMNAILGFAALAQANLHDEALVADYLGKINTSSTHLLNLINDILDMSRIESGSVQLEEKPVHLPSLLKELRDMVQGLADARQQHLDIDTQGVQTEDIVVDKLRLNQILLNIVSNAIKFTQDGGKIYIRLQERPCEELGYITLEFVIQDNGIGMSKDFVSHVFDTFTREYTATVSGIQGTGLGMAITKNLVEMMGGTIVCQSQEGHGTQFTVTLKVRKAEKIAGTQEVENKLLEPEQQAKPASYDYRGKRILLVEDNELNREIATAMLSATGMEIDTAEDGAEAVNIINEAPADKYDLILMDIQMPRMDGYTATREIRTLPNNTKANIPIVAMTANAFEEDRRKAFETGMNGHVVKPISMEEIARTLDGIFATK